MSLREKKKVEVRLVGEDGNAFSILGRVSKAMRRAGWTQAEVEEYIAEATSGNYDNLLRITMEYTVDIGEEE